MASTYTMVAYGSQGSAVRQLQNELNKRGYSLDQDGIFGKKTRAAVRDYQKKNGLTMVDGIAGDETWGSLLSAPTAAEQAALAEYQQEGKALQNQYSMLDAQEKADYDRWQEARGDWQKQLEAAQAAYEDAGSQDQKLYQTLLAHFSDKAEQERKLSASGVRLTDSGGTGSRSESLSSTAAESLQRAVVNYLKRGNGDLAQALAAQYTARMTPAQRQRFEKLLGQYGMTLA